jgi:hypothetical protein
LLAFLAHIYYALLLVVSAAMVVVLFAGGISIAFWMLRRFVDTVAGSLDLPKKLRRRTRRLDQWHPDHPLFSRRAGQ